MNITQKLFEFSTRTMSTVPNVNSGGCGIFAFKTFHVLKQFGLDTEIIFANHTISNKQKVNSIVYGRKYYEPHHIMLKLPLGEGFILYDASGFFDLSIVEKINSKEIKLLTIKDEIDESINGLYTISENYLINLLLRKDLWNSDYQHSDDQLIDNLIHEIFVGSTTSPTLSLETNEAGGCRQNEYFLK